MTRRRVQWQAVLATAPMIAVCLSLFLVGTLCIVYWSFTQSAAFPNWKWFGALQYGLLWSNRNWQASVLNLAVFAPAFVLINAVVGFLLAMALDQHVRFERVFHTLFLYPYALSLYVTGLVWQWMFDPHFGLAPTLESVGLGALAVAPPDQRAQSLAALLVAGCWQSIGLTMTILLSGLRSIDPDIWRACRVDGIPRLTTYVVVILPMMRGALLTAGVLLITTALRTYDLAVAMVDDPNRLTWMPAIYVLRAIWYDVSLRQGAAAATMMLLPIGVLLIALRIAARRQRPA